MRILVLNQYFRPEVAASAQRLSELVDELAKRHDVTVVAGRPSYDPERPAGTASGLTPRVSHDRPGEARVVRVPSTGFHRQRMLARILNYVTYLAWAFLHGAIGRKPDIVIAATDPPLVGFVGLCVSWLRRSVLVHILWDIQPQAAIAAQLLEEGRLTRVLDRLNRLVLRGSSAIVVPTCEMRESAIALGAPASRVTLLSHWEDTDVVRPVPKDNPFSRAHDFAGRFVVMYSGNLGLTQRLDACLELASRVRDLDELRIVMVGDGAARAKLQQEARERRLTNVRFLPYQPREQLRYSLGAADVCLAPLGSGLTRFMLPSKIYSIMAAGRPLLALLDASSELSRLITSVGCGRVVAPGDIDALEAAVRWFHAYPAEREAMGRRAREAAERQWSRSVIAPRFAALVEQLAQ